MAELTTRETDALAAVVAFIDREGYSPSVRDIQHALGLRSTQPAYRLLTRLQDKGLITWNPRVARTIQPTPTAS
jgi:SOS-response transcriptional repressor LexA